MFVSENQTFNSLIEGSYAKEITLYVQVILTSIGWCKLCMFFKIVLTQELLQTDAILEYITQELTNSTEKPVVFLNETKVKKKWKSREEAREDENLAKNIILKTKIAYFMHLLFKDC